jgi:putative ABC transport system permease protein
VVIISESMAHLLFPNGNPIGHRIRRADVEKPEWSQIVGIAADARPASLYQRPFFYQVYHPLAREPWQYAMFAVRAQPGAQKSVLAAVGPAVASVNPDLPVTNLMSAEDAVERSSFDLGMLMKMLGAFATLGLLLAALGIYGVIARTVVQRTPEIGIRLALGATMADVRRLIIGSGLRLALIGACIGLAGGVAITKLLGSMMPAVEGSPFSVVTGSMGMLAAVAIIASYLPARAASKVNPVAAMRAQ